MSTCAWFLDNQLSICFLGVCLSNEYQLSKVCRYFIARLKGGQHGNFYDVFVAPMFRLCDAKSQNNISGKTSFHAKICVVMVSSVLWYVLHHRRYTQ